MVIQGCSSAVSALVAQARETQVSIHKDYLQPAEKCKRNLEGLTVDPLAVTLL